MLKMPDGRLSASSAEVLSATSLFVPMTLKSNGRALDMAFDALRGAFEEVKAYLPRLSTSVHGVELVSFESSVPAGLSNVCVALRGKDHQIDLTFALRSPIPPELDFWGRIRLVASMYEQLSVLVSLFEGRKGIDLLLDEARLEPQRSDGGELRIASL